MTLRWWQDRRRREAELAEEIATHLNLAVAERMARGETREQALAAAHRELGSEALVQEVTRTQWSGARAESVIREFLLGVRALRRNPRFTLAAVVCSAIGLGVALAVFSALHAVLLRPLPYANAADLVWLRAQHTTRATSGAVLSPETLELWRSAETLTDIGTWRGGTTDLTGRVQLPERVTSAAVTANLLPLLGTAPLHGRWFDTTEEVAGAGDVVLLGHDLWRARFGADPGLVGATIEILDRPYRVIGIMPQGFSFPEGAQLWTPLAPPELPPDILFYDGAIGRRAPDASVLDVRENILAITLAAGLAYEGWEYLVVSMHDELVGPLRRPILIFQGAAVLVLLLACANVGALLLARSAARQQELAVRAALGAGRGRLMQHVLLECLAVAALGGALGMAVAWAGMRLFALAFPDGVPSYIELVVHPPVLLLALALTLLTALLFGAAPALLAGRMQPHQVLGGGARGVAGTRSRGRGALVAAQLAVSVVLLASAMLLVRSHAALEDSIGFDAAGVFTVGVDLPRSRYADADGRVAFSDRLREALAGLPDVTAVSSSMTAAPLQEGTSGGLWEFRVVGADAASVSGERAQMVARHLIAPGYVGALGVPIIAGRDISEEDARAGEPTALVNETFARRYFPGGDVLGQRIEIQYAPGQWGGAERVVGVVRDFRHAAPPAELEPATYVHHPPGPPRLTVIVRTGLSDPAVLAPAVRQLVRDIDPSLTLRMHAQAGVVERTFWRQRLQRNVISAFAVLATALALFGVYGVLSYAVAQRTAELGVRLALGASARRLLLHVLFYAARLALVGVVIGVAAAVALTRVLRGLLYAVEPGDPVVLTGAAVALFTVALCAAVVPAWRASRLDPQVAIRSGG